MNSGVRDRQAAQFPCVRLTDIGYLTEGPSDPIHINSTQNKIAQEDLTFYNFGLPKNEQSPCSAPMVRSGEGPKLYTKSEFAGRYDFGFSS